MAEPCILMKQQWLMYFNETTCILNETTMAEPCILMKQQWPKHVS